MSDDTSAPSAEQPSGGDLFGMPRRDIFEDPTIPSSVKLVYTALTMYANPATRLCWPGRSRIALGSSLSVRTVATAIRVGEEIGLWTVTRTQTSNRYHLHDRADDLARYVVGSGPLSSPGSDCTLEEQQSPSGDAVSAHEVDKRTRPASQTISSGDAFAASGHRASAPTDRKIVTDKLWHQIHSEDVGAAANYLIKAAYGVMTAADLPIATDARDQMAKVLRNVSDKHQAHACVQTWMDNLDTRGANGSSLIDHQWEKAS